MTLPSIVQLKGTLQPFSYGRVGHQSWAAQYALATPSHKADIEKDGGIKDEQPYGEIWLGSTHPNGPAKVEGSNEELKDLIRKDVKFYLGEKLLADKDMERQYREDLPWLFKVLSFDKPLPLQAHPDKKLGEQLKDQEKSKEGENSDFVDSNAKPEVGVALSPFTAFVGFRPPKQLSEIFNSVSEFREIFSESTLTTLNTAANEAESLNNDKHSVKALRALFDEVINLSPARVKELNQRLRSRLDMEGAETVFGVANRHNAGGEANASRESEAEAMARVYKLSVETYGEEDVGTLAATALMNLLRMKKGEGAWILADDLHAYVEGDIIECMANSDNMVAHGLGTEEQGGIKTFVEMLSYRSLPANDLLLKYEDKWSGGKHGRTRRYDVPISEFDLLTVKLDDKGKAEELAALDSPLTFVVTQGSVIVSVGSERLELSKGQAGFVRANVDVAFESRETNEAEVWGAFWQ